MIGGGLGLGSADRAFFSSVHEAPSGPRRSTHGTFPLSSARAPRFLVPLGPAAASATAVRGYTTPSSPIARLSAAAVTSAFRLGAANALPRRLTVGGPGTFVDHVLERFPTGAAFSVHLGPPRANRKPVMHIMDHHGRSSAYVKLGVNSLTCSRVRAESLALAELSHREMLGLLVPELIDSGTWDDLDYLVMRPVHTGRPAEPSLMHRRRATEALVAAFPSFVCAVVDAPWWARTVSSLESRSGGSDADQLSRAAQRIARKYGRIGLRHGASHGDWTPWNMGAHADEVVAVWDWERFATDLPVGWDGIHYHVASHAGDAAAGLRSARSHLTQIIGDASNIDEREAILATYLLHRGAAFVTDRQQAAGAPNGPLARWLLPALEALA